MGKAKKSSQLSQLFLELGHNSGTRQQPPLISNVTSSNAAILAVAIQISVLSFGVFLDFAIISSQIPRKRS